jgi:glutathione synthase/RimK-type ligase-like ATP-grasp enzyme
VPAFAGRGIEAVPTVWTAPDVRWTEFDGVVVRSCWDYHRRIDQFHAWLIQLEQARVRVWNQPHIIRWNADKSYLRDLAERGVPTIPTLGVDRDSAASLSERLIEHGWRRIVIKPRVSASGYETHALDVPFDAASEATVAGVVARGDALVQPFADEIPRDGEYSLVFLGGAYSHAALKRATRGEFRVQEEHGGTLEPISPGESIIEQATRALDAVDGEVVYARVDGIVRDDRFLLMELELIEPNLFLAMRSGAANDFVEAILRRL